MESAIQPATSTYWFPSYLSSNTLASLLRYYSIISIKLTSWWQQLCFSTRVLRSSANDQFIRFYKVGSVYVPIHSVLHDVPYMMPGELQWMYNCTDKTFTEVAAATREVRKLPYIGATITTKHGEEMIADMSDWLIDVHTHSASIVPVHVLVGAYAFTTQTYLMRDLHQLTLRCMSLSLDETVYNLGTGLLDDSSS